ncbi:hypothetical protein N1495_01360 [Streptococcus didelphis]|uniref:Uncharacterized protein n=1 Tax=Streptococcus didelphis TaxID=102886 RepID=A0ABY9LG70_9STRE|nr:hypothetical protein [Streptococcus didelphis]WMB27844.1 hypothetical protein N1496_07250 [Streptococcus didelphis]WMB29694.1 hypothetical protein N1495_01360 [Streptococcus didelphis]
MLKDIKNKNGMFYRDLPDYFQEYHLEFKNFEDIKELIDYWGLIYRGEPKVDNRQLIDFMRKRKVSEKQKAERILIKQDRIKLRSKEFNALEIRKIKDMSLELKLIAQILYRAKLCEIVI